MYMITSATSEKNIGEVKTPAPSRAAGKTTPAANATATVMGVQKAQISELLSSLSLAQGKLPESLSAKQNTLIRYLSALDGGHAAELGKNTNPTAKQVGSLVSRLIGKFPDLNRQISDTLSRQGLSGKSGDALSAEISQNLANLPKIIQEGAPAGRALVEFFAQSAIARLDPKKLNQTLVKQMNNSGLSTVADTTPRQQREIAKVLDSTVAFIYRNQNRPAGTSVSATASGTAERSSAGGDFTDPTYRNPVQNRQTSTPQLSAGEQSALMDKVRNLLSGAAQTAISARLIEAPGQGAAGEDADVSEESLNKAEQMLRQFVKEHPGSSDRQPSDLSDALKQAAASRTGTTTLVDLASGKKTEQTAVDTGATRKTSGQTQETPGEQQTRITQEIARNFSIIHKSFNLDTIEKAVAAIRDLQKQQTLKAENQTVTEQSADETANPDDLKTVGKMMKSMLSSNNQETAKPSAESQQTVAAKTAVDPQNVPAKTAETESPQAAAKTTVDLQNAAAKTAAAETTTAAAKTTVDSQNAPAKTVAAETQQAAAKTTVNSQNAPAKTVATETQQAAAKTTVDPQNAPAKTVAAETTTAAAKTTVDPQNAPAKTAAAETTTAAAKTTVDPQNAPAKTAAAETQQAAAKTTVDPQNATAKTAAAETTTAAAKTTVDPQNAPAKTVAAETTTAAAKTAVDSQNALAKTAAAETPASVAKTTVDSQNAAEKTAAAETPQAAAKTTVDSQNASAKTAAAETTTAAAKTTVDPQNAPAKTVAAETTTATAKTTVDPQNAPAKTVAPETQQAAAKTTVDPQNAVAKTTAAETPQAAAKTTVDPQNATAKTAATETTASAAKTTVDSQNTAAKTASAVPQVKNNADPQKAGIREQAATEPKQTRSTAEMIYQQNKQSVTRTDETIRSKPEQPSAATARTTDSRAETPTGAEVEKRGLFRKIAGLFTRSESAAAARPADSPQQRPAVQLETPVTAKPVETGTASPVKTQITATGLNQIMQDFADPSIPDNMKRNARNIEQMFNASLADTPSLLQWLNYMDNPLSGNSSMSKGLRAWASMLVAVRLKQFGINVEEELRSPRGKMLKLLQDGADVGDSEQWPQKMLDNLTRHLDTLHNSAQQTRNEGNVWPFYLPLPTPKENRRENCMLLKRSKSEEGQDHGLDLNFYFEIAPFGSIGIKVNYNSPDLKLRATAESYDGYSRLRETLHLLQKRFSELGLNSSDFECRRGSVKHPSDYTDQELQFMQDDEFDGWRV